MLHEYNLIFNIFFLPHSWGSSCIPATPIIPWFSFLEPFERILFLWELKKLPGDLSVLRNTGLAFWQILRGTFSLASPVSPMLTEVTCKLPDCGVRILFQTLRGMRLYVKTSFYTFPVDSNPFLEWSLKKPYAYLKFKGS